MQILGRMQLFNQVVIHHIYQCHFNYDVFRPTNLHKYNQFERRSFLSFNSVIASETPYLNRSKNSFNVSLATLYNRSMYQQLNHYIRIWQSISIIFSSFAIYDQILFFLPNNRMTYDDVYRMIGSCGRYQKLIYVLQTLPVMFAAVQTYLSVFILYVPDHR